MRRSYPSDISREQFEEIREELAGAKKKTHPRSYDLYDSKRQIRARLYKVGYRTENSPEKS